MGNTQGGVPKSEVEEWRKKYNLPPEKVKWTMKAFQGQKGKNNVISKAQFIEMMVQQGADEEFSRAIFDFFDKDESGILPTYFPSFTK